MDRTIKIVIAVLLTLSYCSCNNKSKDRKTTFGKPDIVPPNVVAKKTPAYLADFNSRSVSNSGIVFVKPGGQNDDGAVYLNVDSNSVAFIFGLNRCEYSFPCINENNKIKLKWNLDDGECDYKNSLSQTFGLKNYPKKNEIFAEIEPQEDSAIKVTYFFKAFIDKQNQKGRENREFKIDTIFPTIFKVHQ